MAEIPGFEDAVEPTTPFERLALDDAIGLVEAHYPLSVLSAVRMDAARHDRFRLATDRGEYTMVVAHPDESGLTATLQLDLTRATEKQDATLPVQRLLRTLYGSPVISTDSGRIAWVLEWMPGDSLRQVIADSSQLVSLGDTLGRLSVALGSNHDRDTEYVSVWDLQCIPRLGALLARYPNPVVSDGLGWFSERVEAQFADLPTQVVHNGFGSRSVVVDRSDHRFVTGILAFDRAVYSVRVADLVVALGDQLSPLRRNWNGLAPLIDAFDRRVTLLPVERELLPHLVIAHLAQRVLLDDWFAEQGLGRADQRDTLISALDALLERFI